MQRFRGGVSPPSARERHGVPRHPVLGCVVYTCGVTQVSGAESVPLAAPVNLGVTQVGDDPGGDGTQQRMLGRVGHELAPPSSEGHHCVDVCLL